MLPLSLNVPFLPQYSVGIQFFNKNNIEMNNRMYYSVQSIFLNISWIQIKIYLEWRLKLFYAYISYRESICNLIYNGSFLNPLVFLFWVQLFFHRFCNICIINCKLFHLGNILRVPCMYPRILLTCWFWHFTFLIPAVLNELIITYTNFL